MNLIHNFLLVLDFHIFTDFVLLMHIVHNLSPIITLHLFIFNIFLAHFIWVLVSIDDISDS